MPLFDFLEKNPAGETKGPASHSSFYHLHPEHIIANHAVLWDILNSVDQCVWTLPDILVKGDLIQAVQRGWIYNKESFSWK